MTLTPFASTCKRASYACDLGIPQANEGLLFLCPRAAFSSTSLLIKCSFFVIQCQEGWQTALEEGSGPSENPLVILQVVKEDSGRHGERLRNVKQSGFYSGCLVAAVSAQ